MEQTGDHYHLRPWIEFSVMDPSIQYMAIMYRAGAGTGVPFPNSDQWHNTCGIPRYPTLHLTQRLAPTVNVTPKTRLSQLPSNLVALQVAKGSKASMLRSVQARDLMQC